MYDIEVSADRYEQEATYRLECAVEDALEQGTSHTLLSELEQNTQALLERIEAHERELEEVRRKEIEMFTAWLS